jgi:hypothetical protein
LPRRKCASRSPTAGHRAGGGGQRNRHRRREASRGYGRDIERGRSGRKSKKPSEPGQTRTVDQRLKRSGNLFLPTICSTRARLLVPAPIEAALGAASTPILPAHA